MKILKTVDAIVGVGAWPNLTLLPDGTIIAVVWNQPCHGHWEGDIDCYASEDGGESWALRATISQHEPGTNRMNCAVGLAANGDLLAVVSGWNDRQPVGVYTAFDNAVTLRPWVYRSADGGHTWRKTGDMPETGQKHAYIPYGDLHYAGDGALCVSAYTQDADDRPSAFLFRSYDDGESWGDKTSLHPAGNETAIYHLGDGHWLAAARVERQVQVELLDSFDDGRSWSARPALTQPNQVPAHLLRLRDGRLLCCYGSRIEGQYGVEARCSLDEGQTWEPPLHLGDMPDWDGGYPSSIEREDGVIVTAYYSHCAEAAEYSYRMTVVLWTP